MKTVQKYRCEVCNTDYADKAEAVSCEKNHKIPQSIVSARYLSKNMNDLGYPVSVTVRMSNGEDIIYKR